MILRNSSWSYAFVIVWFNKIETNYQVNGQTLPYRTALRNCTNCCNCPTENIQANRQKKQPTNPQTVTRIDCPTNRLTDWQTYRLTDRQTNRPTDWQTDGLTDRPTDWSTDRLTDWQKQRQTNKGKQINKQTDKKIDKDNNKDRNTELLTYRNGTDWGKSLSRIARKTLRNWKNNRKIHTDYNGLNWQAFVAFCGTKNRQRKKASKRKKTALRSYQLTYFISFTSIVFSNFITENKNVLKDISFSTIHALCLNMSCYETTVLRGHV